jgi:hypothetical protein
MKNNIANESVDALLEKIVERKLEEKLAELRTIAGGVRLYHQDARHPALDSRVLHLRAHRALRREGHPGATSRGRHRLLTEAAILDWTSRQPEKRSSAPKSVDDELLAELGARRAS